MGKHRVDVSYENYISYMKVSVAHACDYMALLTLSLGLFDLDRGLQRFDVSHQDIHHLAILPDFQGHSLLPILFCRHGGPRSLDSRHVFLLDLHMRPRPQVLGHRRAGQVHELHGPLAVRRRHQHDHRHHLLPHTDTASPPAADA